MYHFRYTPEDVDCTFCTEYSHCDRKDCPWFAERIEAGVVGYAQAIQVAFSHDHKLDSRFSTVIRHFSGSLFLNTGHQQRMEQLKAGQERNAPPYFAALYLLSANRDLYSRTKRCFIQHGIAFHRADLCEITPYSYTLFSAARDIFLERMDVTLSDLSNTEVVDELAFRLIVNALLIARYGPAVLEIRERSCP